MLSEDTDLVLTAFSLGLGSGLFRTLRLDHVIPPERLTEESLLRLVKRIRFSGHVLELLHAPHKPPPANNWCWWLKYACDSATKFGQRGRFYRANKQAQRSARLFYEEMASAGLLSAGDE
jgi:hypothetical protein